MKRSNLFRRLMTGGLVAGIIGSMLPIGAGAGNQTWGAAADLIEPGTSGLTLGRMTVANDGTIFAVADGVTLGGFNDIAFSTNGGASWTVVDGDAAGNWGAPLVTDVVPSPTFGVDRNVFVGLSDGNSWRSVAGGATGTWLDSGTAAATGGNAVTDLAVAPDFANGAGQIAISWLGATAANVQRSTCTATPACGTDTTIAFAGLAIANEATEGALAVEFSPNYASDGVIFAVGTSAAAGTMPCLSDTAICEVRSTSGLAFGTAVDISSAATGTLARIAFPTGYNVSGADNYFVGSSISVYRRAQGLWTDTLPVTAAGAAATPATSISVNGSFSGAILMVGATAASGGLSQIARSTDGGVTWSTVVNIGGTTGAVNVAMSPDFATNNTVYADSTGVNGGFWWSTTGGSSTLGYSSRGAYVDLYTDINAITGDPADANPLFVIQAVTGGTAALFRSTAAVPTATTWSKTGYFSAATAVTAVGVSRNYASDSTVYIGGGTTIAKSTNGGASFSTAFINPIPSGVVNTGGATGGKGIVVANTSTVFVLASGGRIHMSTDSGANWTTTTVAGSPTLTDMVLSPNYAVDSDILLGGRSPGGAALVWWSGDAGATWTALTHPDTATAVGRVGVAFDSGYATNNMVYSVTDTDVYRWQAGTSTAWQRLSAGAHNPGAAPDDLPSGDGDMTNLAVANGVLYSSQSAAGVAGDVTDGTGVRRSLNPEVTYTGASRAQWFDLGWDSNASVTGGLAGSSTLTTGAAWGGATLTQNNVGMFVVPVSATSNLIIAVDTATAPDSIIAFTDLLLPAPTTTNPANGASLASAPGTGGVPPLSWAPYTNLGTAAFEVRVSTDPTFQDLTNTTYIDVAASVFTVAAPAAPAFTAGQTYYWQVMAMDSAGENNQSHWSATSSYTAAAGVPNPTFPVSAPGLIQTTDTVTPGLTWAAVANATDYRVQIATNPSTVSAGGSYVSPLITRTVGSATPNLQLLAGDLRPGVTYYWQVQPVFGTASGLYTNVVAGGGGATSVFKTSGSAPPVVGGCVAPATALAPIASKLEIASNQNETTGKWHAYVPGLPGNTMLDICPNSVVILTMKTDTTVTVSGVTYTLKAGIGKAIGVHSSVSFS